MEGETGQKVLRAVNGWKFRGEFGTETNIQKLSPKKRWQQWRGPDDCQTENEAEGERQEQIRTWQGEGEVRKPQWEHWVREVEKQTTASWKPGKRKRGWGLLRARHWRNEARQGRKDWWVDDFWPSSKLVNFPIIKKVSLHQLPREGRCQVPAGVLHGVRVGLQPPALGLEARPGGRC